MFADRTDRDAAFAEFVRARQGSLIRFAWLACGDDTQAEDLVQEALTRLYGRWAQVSEPEAYVRATISRINISVWRKFRREMLHSQPVERAELDRRLDALGEEDAALLRAVRTLPTRQRLAIVLRFWCDYGDDQIAEALGCATTTVRSTIHRGLTRLREIWPEPSNRRMTGVGSPGTELEFAL